MKTGTRTSVTRKERKLIEKELAKQTQILGKEKYSIIRNNRHIYFYKYALKMFSEYPQFIAWIKGEISRNIEIETYLRTSEPYNKITREDVIELNIRTYADEYVTK